MSRGVQWSLLGSAVVAALIALAGCSHYFSGEREAWRGEAEVACLNSGAVKESPERVRISAITGPGMCGADYPLRVSALGESGPLGYDDEPLRPPGAIPDAALPPRWPVQSNALPPPPRRHSTVRHNTVRCHRDNHNTVHRNMGRRLDTVRCNLCRRSLPRWQRKVTRLPLRSRPGHRCRSILRASRQRKKTISIFSPVRHSLTAPHPPHGQAPCRRRIHRAAIRRLITRRPTLRQITRSKVLRRRLTHHAPSHCHPAQRNQFRSARRAHRWSLERLGRSK